MTDGRIPEGRKPLTDADIAALTRRLAGTAVDYKELYEAAKRDAEEAEAYAAELEAKLAKVVDECARIAESHKPSAALLSDRYWRGVDEAAHSIAVEIYATLAELKGQDDE